MPVLNKVGVALVELPTANVMRVPCKGSCCCCCCCCFGVQRGVGLAATRRTPTHAQRRGSGPGPGHTPCASEARSRCRSAHSPDKGHGKGCVTEGEVHYNHTGACDMRRGCIAMGGASCNRVCAPRRVLVGALAAPWWELWLRSRATRWVQTVQLPPAEVPPLLPAKTPPHTAACSDATPDTCVAAANEPAHLF